ncbi:hypothetical protein BDF22DRAFT_675676 [Syncephalis plumigaleata]|nr:hypothetical protein BDF22DRAFT_675676 [Syncephalis plumigaleata]
MARQSARLATRAANKLAQSAKKEEKLLAAEVESEEQDYLTVNTVEDNDNPSSELDEALEDAISSQGEADSSNEESGSNDDDNDDVSEDEGDSDAEETEDAFVKNTSIVALDPAQQEVVQARLQQAKSKARKEQATTGVVYVGRIPHGFYEDEMRGYFGQFGTVSRLRLSRNKKTGRSKHYAFIEFSDADVADVVAETMNNYLLFGRMLKCQVVPAQKVHSRLFDGADRKYKPLPLHKMARAEHNRSRTAEEAERHTQRLLRKENNKRKRLQEMGIDYDFPGFAAVQKPKVQHTSASSSSTTSTA